MRCKKVGNQTAREGLLKIKAAVESSRAPVGMYHVQYTPISLKWTICLEKHMIYKTWKPIDIWPSPLLKMNYPEQFILNIFFVPGKPFYSTQLLLPKACL